MNQRPILTSTILLAVTLGLLARNPNTAEASLYRPAPQPAAAPDPANTDQGQAANEAQDRGWPREFDAGDQSVIVHQPQLEDWANFDRITFRAAISVGPKDSDNRAYGVIRVSADTKVAFEDRLVILTGRKLESLTFPDVTPDEAERLKAIVYAAMPPERPQTISLDRLIAQMDVNKVAVRTADVSLAPPPIFFSNSPAVIVNVMGKPRLKAVPTSGGKSDPSLMYALNTNWDLFFAPGTGAYYLLNDNSWLTTSDLDKGPWTAATSLPPALSTLPAEENWNDVRAAIPGTPATEVPRVFVSYAPAELIVTQGDPALEAIPGTGLFLVTNTESKLFLDAENGQYFFLTAGRWFSAAALSGPWAAASAALPADFKKIPTDSPAADVLASVPGTPEANDAIIMASIPNKATVSRTEVTVNVVYDGTPQFKPIESTTIQYAANTPFSVFLVDGKYYCCSNAVWFVAPSPSGAWAVCTSVPAAIYTIPPTSPFYNVTYVQVYESTPTTVVYGYTSGYSGATVAATGAVMFGLGVVVGAAIANNNDDCCWSYHSSSCFYSYGCGAVYHGASGGYVCGSSVYGPYGGAGHAAAYNPSTGVYSRAGYAYGPNGAAGYRTAYNPSTGTAGYHAGGSTPYSSWGRGAVSNGDQWVRGGYKSTANGTAGAIQGSGGGEAATVQGKYGNGATVAKTSDGDMYAGKDGNVYKNTGSGWEKAGSSSTSTQSAPKSQPSTSPNSTATKSQTPPPQAGNLQSEAANRSRGNTSATSAQNYQRSSGSSSGGSRGGGASGGGRRR